ncbi:MAG: hypothetical protein ABF661_03275 [Oenococcus sp.]|uniref:hypothetical protein n=1 Tax=Oenococcus sp. TaxID=1979414 RepID=UPI0039EAA6D7
MTNASYILGQKNPFSYQHKDRLVYCNLTEHLILRALIASETHGHFGYPGLIQFIQPCITDWYISGIKPEKGWQKKCFEVAYMTSDQAKILLNTIATRLASSKQQELSPKENS